ncbi:hypothetical protein FHS68_001377 [Dyadobacter arcticus]|uniref:Uncharacterized protein n=1 Tax=Dyadobacter arcticus TaxID=1078754 RepID=A0ABX0UMB2_9BACT|nr:hypothetical protein [Dyadobacter arcticus]
MRCYFCFFPVIRLKSRKKTSQQKKDTLEFIEYRDFEVAFKSGKDVKQLRNSFDFESILVLDSTRAKVLFEFDPQLRENLNYASAAAKLRESTVGFVTDFESLRDVLQ